MRMPWSKSKAEQLELLEAEFHAPRDADRQPVSHDRAVRSITSPTRAAASHDGRPLVVPLDRVDEDPNNPRTEFPDTEIDELAEDIRQHGILQPIVVHPADQQGRYRIHFGAKRWRAAQRAGLTEVPVVVRDTPTDPYARVAENQKRHGLTPLDLAQFIRSRVNAGDSNATIAKRLGMDQTTVAHHLGLLDLPPELDEAMRSGRCTSPRTLHELSKLHREQPKRARALLDGDTEITRCAVNAVRTEPAQAAGGSNHRHPQPSPLAQADAACGQLARALDRVAKAEPRVVEADLDLLKQRVASLASRLT